MPGFFQSLILLILVGVGHAVAQSGATYDVLCDAKVEVYSCHPPHPYGTVVEFDELNSRLNHFGAGTMTVHLTSGQTVSSRRFSAIENAFIIGGDTVRPKEVRSFVVQATWPHWRTVAQLAAGGAVFFGGVGLIVDGLQWVGGSGGDLGATWTGAVVGAGLFGGLGILVARERYEVRIQEGIEQRTVEGPALRSAIANR